MSDDGSRCAAPEAASRLWPQASGPADLARIEQTPLAQRGLPASTYELVTRAATLWPDRGALSVLPDAERWQSPMTRTFAQLADDVQRAARVLASLGVGRGDAVAVLSANCAEMLPLLLAAEAVGVFAPINPALAPEHVTQLVQLAGSKVIVASGPELDARVWARAREVAQRAGARVLLAMRPTGSDGAPPPLQPLDEVHVAYLGELMSQSSGTGIAGSVPLAGDTASFIHTGGTTGLPKLAARTHANEVTNAWMIGCTDLLEPGATIFAALPLFHTNALIVTVLEPLLKGQHVVWAGPAGYREPTLYSIFWRLVERFRISAMSGVPTVYQQLAHVPVDADISSLRLPIVGAAPLPPAVRSAFEARTGVAMCEGYGLTEGTCASSRSWPGHPRPGTVGQRLPYQEARTVRVDETTGEWAELPPGEVGNLVLRGPNIFPGYVTRDRAGRVVQAGERLRDGWLDTGDLASVDADGFIHLAGRAKDLIIRGGHNIDPRTIEDALLAHPDVTAAAAVGRPDDHAGEVPVAFVTVSQGSQVTPEELVAWAAERVPETAAAPKAVQILPEIPHTPIGKQYKPELRRQAAEQAAEAALSGTAAEGQALAVLVNGAVEIHVCHSQDDDAVERILAAYPWTWRWSEAPTLS